MTIPYMPDNLKRFKSGAPAGYTTLKNPTAAVAAKAKELLKNNMGDEFRFEILGVSYFARVEPHYHPPGYKNGPNGWHKGVTVYVSKEEKLIPKSLDQQTKTPNTEALPVLKQEKPKYNLLSELDKIVKRLMG